MTAKDFAKRFPTKHDFHHAVTGKYLFSTNGLRMDVAEKLEKELTPVKVYRNSTPSFDVRHDRRFLRYQTPFNA